MNSTYKYLLSGVLYFMALEIGANLTIDFEGPENYKSLGIYDVWVESPFNTGELNGNWSVTENPDKESGLSDGTKFNDSDYVLGAQRSRFGSNRFGVRIDLEKPIRLSPEEQFVHVMIHKPKAGRVMLIGLGSREERLNQNPFTEQFWVLSNNIIKENQWNDAVFRIRGAEGIVIRSLVIVPDCESPHDLKEDFLFYVDNIQINDSALPVISNEFYPIAGEKNSTPIIREESFTTGIGLNRNQENQKFDIEQNQNRLLYQNLLKNTFFATPGETITPYINYDGNLMHAYCYVDFDKDGYFNTSYNKGNAPSIENELVSFNYFKGKNSKGKNIKDTNLGNDTGVLPSFTLPENLQPGFYRMRYKIDWDNIDPAGNSSSYNNIAENGGMIADVMLCVYAPYSTVNDNQLNGEVLAEDGNKLNDMMVQADLPFTIKMAPEKGFYNGGVEIKAGYEPNNGDYLDDLGNPQYVIYSVTPDEFNKEDSFTLPANWIRGNILISGNMVEDNP